MTAAALALGLLVGFAPAADASANRELVRVSVASATESEFFSMENSLSSDGRQVAFSSGSGNLVPGDTNLNWDVFLRDRHTETTERVSITWDGREANDASLGVAVNGNARYVAFGSVATNLVRGDGNRVKDIFVRDRQARGTERISVSSGGIEGNAASDDPSISDDGRYVAFQSEATNLVAGDRNRFADIFVRDRVTRRTERVSVPSGGGEGNGKSTEPAISPNGRYVAFTSGASNLVPGDRNVWVDVFVHDRDFHTTERVSVSSAGAEGNNWSARPSISGDGRSVAFTSAASNLVPGDRGVDGDIFVRDTVTDRTEQVSVTANGVEADNESFFAAISSDACVVAYSTLATNLAPGADPNAIMDVLVRDCRTGRTERASVTTAGTTGDDWSDIPAVSASGRYVSFGSTATNLVPGDTNGTWDVFLRDRQLPLTERVSVPAATEGNGTSRSASVSSDGRHVAFASAASNLVPADGNRTWDVFVRDALNEVTLRVSVAPNGAEGNGWSDSPSISPDARYVGFDSQATNLVARDGNRTKDVFLRDLRANTTQRASVASNGTEGNGESYQASVSGDGNYVAFVSDANNLVARDLNGARDIFIRDRVAGRTERVSIASDGTEGSAWSTSPSISDNGRYVAFASLAPNLVPGDGNGTWDIFVHDRGAHTTERVSVGPRIGAANPAEADGASYEPSISADGLHVAFTSMATNLVAPADGNGVEDVFVRDRGRGTTSRVSVDTNRVEGNGDSESPSISGDGRYVVFASRASNLVRGDANGTWDVFVHDLSTWVTRRASTSLAGTEANSSSHGPQVSDDGSWVAFHSDAQNLLPGDTNGVTDVFLRRRP